VVTIIQSHQPPVEDRTITSAGTLIISMTGMTNVNSRPKRLGPGAREDLRG